MELSRRLVAIAAASAALAPLAIGSSAVAQNADEAAITANIEAFRKATISQDKAVLEGLVSDKLIYGHSDGRLENKAEFIAGVMGRKAKLLELKYPDVKVRVTGNNATVRHGWESVSELDGKKTDTKIDVTQVWQKQADGKWLLASRLSFRPA